MALSALQDDGICAICQDAPNDPIMCSDGYCYCRICIAQWVGLRREWTSPLTGRVHYGPALLTPDFIRAGVARERLRGYVLTLEPWHRFTRTALARFGLGALCSPTACAAVLSEPTLEESLMAREASGGWWLLHLELCWRTSNLSAFPAHALKNLMQWDRNENGPLIQRRVWEGLVAIAANRFYKTPDVANRNIAFACRQHFAWRLQQVDAVYVRANRAPGRAALLLLRESWADGAGGLLLWRAVGGARLRVPVRPRAMTCSTELDDSELIPAHGETQWYGSRVPVSWRGGRLWTRRRGRAEPPFPDHDGTEDPSTARATESTRSTTASSESDEDEFTVSSSSSSVPPEEASLLKLLRGDDHLSVCEKALESLPDGFEYVPRVQDCDAAQDTNGTLAQVNEALVSGLLEPKRGKPATARRTRQRLCT